LGRIYDNVTPDNHEQTYCKYWLDSLLCTAVHDHHSPPNRPDWVKEPLFSGYCRRFISRAVASHDLSFIYSLQKGSKRSWPALSDVSKQAAFDKHYARLSTPQTPISDSLRTEITLVSREVFQIQGSEDYSKFMPSGSACMQASRRCGGSLSLFNHFKFPRLNLDERQPLGRLVTLCQKIEDWRKTQSDLAFSTAHERLYRLPAKTGEPEGLNVEVMAIPEPGKFRMITKGDGFVYTALQPLQGLLLKQWKNHSSSTMLHPDLLESVRKIDEALKELPFWCSVDYEAATDLLKKSATFAAFEGVRESPYFNLGLMSLMPGRAFYPKKTGRRWILDPLDPNIRSCLSVEGQLMGHPLSFPLLCVINLAVYRLALKRWVSCGKEKTFEERSRLQNLMKHQVLVNGDDMLFKCTKEFHDDFFLPISKEAGFKISTGKHYLSPFACMINSQLFKRNDRMNRCGYFNQKMLTGSSLKEGDSVATPVQIGREVSKMVLQCPWTRSTVPATMNRFGPEWFGPIYRPNWYFPVHLGGFGLDDSIAPSDWRSRVTKDQRLMASRFINDPSMALYRREGMSIPSAKYANALLHYRFVTGPYVPEKDEVEANSDDWLTRIAYAARARGDPPVDDNVMTVKFKPEYRLKPMSWDRLSHYWVAQMFSRGGPICPPLNVLQTPKQISGSRTITTIRSGHGIIHYDYSVRPTYGPKQSFSYESFVDDPSFDFSS